MSSKSSTNSKLSNKSAWARGPPQTTTAYSANSTPTRSQSPAPQQTHSRRPSTLGQGVSVKDGVAVPRPVKTNANTVTFGSINDASAPISSSPSPAVSPPTAASVKSDVVKSFGSVPAQHPNGTSNSSTTTTATPASAAGAVASSSSATHTPPASASSSTTKLDKKDILKMFQNPSSSSSSSTPPPSNDSANRSSPAPAVSSQPSTSSTPTTSGSSSQPPSFTSSFVPSGSRPPQSSSSSQPPRSPVYPRQLPNGSGPRPQQGGPANNPAAGPASPRLAPPNMQGPGAPAGAPPQGPPQMHPGMPPQPMPGWGYYPGMDPNQAYYMPYTWYVPQMPMQGHPGAPPPPTPHHPQHPNQHHPHPHPTHPGQHSGPPGTPHGPPHSALPMSPRAPPANALPPGTPTTPHAVLHHLPHHPGAPHHGPHHGPGHHSNQGSISVTSPPGTPASTSASLTSPNSASSKLNASSSAFVPGVGNRGSKIVFKNPDGSEVDFNAIAKQTRGDASPGPKSGTFPRQSSPAPTPTSQNGSVAGTPKRRSIRLESEEQRKARLDAEAKEKEAKEAETRKMKEDKEKERKEREAREEREREKEERRRKEEEERKVKERRKKEEDEKEEQARKKKIEEERERKKREAEEERERKKIEEAEKAKREEEEKVRRQKEREERKKREEAERERRKIEEEERKKREAEEAKLRQEREAEEQKQKAEEEERAHAEAEKKAAEEAAVRAKAKEQAASEEPEEGEINETESPTSETAPAPKDVKSGLRINTATSSLSADGIRKRPDPLDLSSAKGPFAGPGAPPSALATARNIENLESVQYPEGILSPRPELNKNVKDGFGFRYDRDFLLQFMKLCTEKPANLPPLHVLGLEPSGEQPSHHGMIRTNSGRHGRNPSGVGSRQPSIGLGISTSKFGPAGSSQPFVTMGNFAGSGASKLSSEDRFAQSQSQRAASMSGGVFGPGGRPSPMTRTASQGGPGHHSNRTRSKRGEKRPEGNKAPSNLGPGANAGFATLVEPVAPLAVSANAWSARRAANQDSDSPEVVDRKVKSLLNKLTMEKFDSISDQIIQWANKSEKEKDGRTLIQVIRLVFEKATDEATWSEMYARLCRKMMERISPQVQDDGIKNNEGKPITGGQLFRKYLLNRCQEDFERGWVNKEATAAAAASKALEDEAIKQANEKQGITDEPVLYSDEYYAAQKAKRQGLGLIKFIGELFKLQMLTERIMHECVKKLLGNVDNPEEEEIESLCKLLTTVGQSLDTPKARAHMDVYFSRMKELTKSQNVSPRMQFMLQDIIELRLRNWITRIAVAAPSTIAQVHENAAKEKAAQEKDVYNRQISMSRGGSRRGGDRGDYPQVGPDGWAVAGSGPSRVPSKAGDLSNFGKITKSTPMTFGPTSVFAGKNKEGKRESISRTNSSSNMFSMLQSAEAGEAAPAKVPEPQRKRLILQPRTVPTEGEAAVPRSPSESSSASEEPESEDTTGGMSVEAAETKVQEDVKEFFAIKSIVEAEAYFTALPAPHHFRLVDKLISQAVESKEDDAQRVTDLFKAAASKEWCTPDAFEQGFILIASMIEDVAIDAPKAVQFFGRIVKVVELDEDRLRRLADKASEGQEDEDKEGYAQRILKAIS